MFENFEKLDSSAMKCMALQNGIWAWIVLIIEIAAILFIGISDVPFWLWIAMAALTAMMAILVFVAPKVRYERYRYCIDEESIRVREGFLWIHFSVVPMQRLQKVELSQGPVARMFQFYTVKAITAGGEVSIRYIKEEKANAIADQLKDTINRIVAEERGKND